LALQTREKVGLVVAIWIVGVGVVVSATGSDPDLGAPESTMAASTSSTTRTDIEAYPALIVEEYMSGCTEEAGEDLCRCTIDEFQQRLTLSEFIELSALLELDDTDPNASVVVLDMIEVCVGRGFSVVATTPPVSETTTTTTTTTTTVVPPPQWEVTGPAGLTPTADGQFWLRKVYGSADGFVVTAFTGETSEVWTAVPAPDGSGLTWARVGEYPRLAALHVENFRGQWLIIGSTGGDTADAVVSRGADPALLEALDDPAFVTADRVRIRGSAVLEDRVIVIAGVLGFPNVTGPYLIASADGVAWQPVDVSGFGQFAPDTVAAAGDRLVMIGEDLDGGREVWVSVDGLAWQEIETENVFGDERPRAIFRVEGADHVITAAGTVVRISESPPRIVGSVATALVDGRAPDSAVIATATVIDGNVVAAGYVFVGQDLIGVVATSTDGVTWTVVYEIPGTLFGDIADGRGVLVVGSSSVAGENAAAYIPG